MKSPLGCGTGFQVQRRASPSSSQPSSSALLPFSPTPPLPPCPPTPSPLPPPFCSPYYSPSSSSCSSSSYYFSSSTSSYSSSSSLSPSSYSSSFAFSLFFICRGNLVIIKRSYRFPQNQQFIRRKIYIQIYVCLVMNLYIHIYIV